MASLKTDTLDTLDENKKKEAIEKMIKQLKENKAYIKEDKLNLFSLVRNVKKATTNEKFDKNFKEFTTTIEKITNKKNPVTTSDENTAYLVAKSNLLSKKAKEKPATKTPIEVIGTLKEQIKVMEKGSEHLEKRIKKCHMDVLKKIKDKNKKGAMLYLTRKKLLEKQLSQKQAQQMNLETQLFALEKAIKNKAEKSEDARKDAKTLKTQKGEQKVGGRRKTKRRKTKRKKTKRRKTKRRKTKHRTKKTKKR